MWKSNSILLNNQWVKKEIKREKRFWNIGQWKHNTPIPVGYSKSSPQRGAGSQNTCDKEKGRFNINHHIYASVQFSSMAQLCQTLCDPMDCSTSGFPVHHELLELAQYHVCRVGDAIQPSHPLSSPSLLSLPSLTRAQIPFMRTLPSSPNHFPKALPPITLGVRFQHKNLGGTVFRFFPKNRFWEKEWEYWSPERGPKISKINDCLPRILSRV